MFEKLKMRAKKRRARKAIWNAGFCPDCFGKLEDKVSTSYSGMFPEKIYTPYCPECEERFEQWIDDYKANEAEKAAKFLMEEREKNGRNLHSIGYPLRTCEHSKFFERRWLTIT